ncbi:hypothetical protein [Chryseolinea lacunae]|uniref:Uncharacterized protein n=1 Tax=Chryseolinea lacunae TaxID=2801331 RepID=A0ABS1KYS5_9BACT|nr:hypothetical protein [Chryseolinea lacunae]MBL0744387.1 hypothetical protein [Chryseolinea lacunae]
MRILFYGVPFTITILIGCSPRGNQHSEEAVRVDSTQPIDSPLEIKVVSQDVATQEVAPRKSYQFDTLSLPKVDKNSPVKILATGTFHANEVWKGVEKENWVAIFRRHNHFFTQKTTVVAKRVHDEIMDADDENTGWSVSTVSPDTAILLVSGITLPEGKIMPLTLPGTEILPGDSITFRYQGNDYALFATGSDKGDPSDRYDIYNYKLYIAANRNGQIIVQHIVAIPNFDDHMVNVIFAGDLDGDNVPDFLIDTASKYNSEMPSLFLSNSATPETLLKMVATYFVVGC